MFLNTFSPTRSPNPEAGSWVVAPHQGRPFGTAQKRSWSLPPSERSSGEARAANRDGCKHRAKGPPILDPARRSRAAP